MKGTLFRFAFFCLVIFLPAAPAEQLPPDPRRALFLFTDVPSGAHLFFDDQDVTTRVLVTSEGWEVASDLLDPQSTRAIDCAFHFDQSSKPQIAKMRLSARAGEILRLSVRSFAIARTAAPSPSVPPPSISTLPASGNTGILRVLVPRTTKLTINDAPTIQEGERREFAAHLNPGESATYRVYIDFRDNTGRQFIRAKNVMLKAGQTVELTLKDFAEDLPR